MSKKFEQKAIEAYSYNARDNINESGVLMVTITLDEYRELVTTKAKADQLKNNMKNWQLCQEMGRLKQLIVDTLAGEDTED